LEKYEVAAVLYVVTEHLGRAPTRSEMVAARRAVRRLAETGRVRAIYEWNARSADGVADSLLTITRLDVGDVHCVRMARKLPAWITPAPVFPEEKRVIPDWVTPDMIREAEERTAKIQQHLLDYVEGRMQLESYEHQQRLLDLQKKKAFLEDRLAARRGSRLSDDGEPPAG
jgi:hypothetical protein